MIDLKCKLTDCKYNKNSDCSAKEISVESEAICSSYEKVDKEEPKDAIPMPAVRHNTSVNCEARCLFRKNGKCIANGITVVDETGKKIEASCSTYMPK